MEDCMRKLVSIVIPCYRSAEMIGGVVADINREMEKLQEKYRWEIILVNDCSPDNTFDVIRELCREYTNICGVNLARNFGQHAALMAGFHQVKGDILVCMDDDGQTPAFAIKDLLQGLEEGSDVVYACLLYTSTFTYYNYRSIYEWGMLFLYLILISCCICLGNSLFFRRDRLLAFIILLSVIATPIGSNNDTMPNLNNLFLAAPFALWMLGKFFRRKLRKTEAFPVMAMSVMIVGMVFLQGIGFRSSFAFGDGIYGEKREAKVENFRVLAGMKTQEINAVNLSGLLGYAEENGLKGRSLITFGNAPGLNFLLDMPLSITHGWPDLDTYPAQQMEEELLGLQEEPAVIIYKEHGELPEESAKWDALQLFLSEKEYILTYENDGYQVYTLPET